MDLGGATTFGLVLSLTCIIFLMVWKTVSKGAKLPPGPLPLPFLGNILQVDNKNLPQSIIKLSKKYGPVFTLHLGYQTLVVLCGYKTIKEALVDQGDDFSGRGKIPAFEIITKGHGVVFSSGERWKQLRRFSLMTLRNFGMGKRSIEERIQEEAQCLVEELRKMKEKCFDPTYFFSKAVSNVISSVVFGCRFDYEDKKFLYMLHILNDNFLFLSSFWGQLFNRFPSIILPLPGPHNTFFKNAKSARRFVKEYIKEHEATLDSNNPRDFIDCFLIKMHKETSNQASEFSMKNLVANTLNLFAAGTETVSTTLRYGFLIFLKFPEIEEKVYQEINSVIGQNRSPCMEDRLKMPYTDAVIHEIQRFIDLLPLSLLHLVTRDTTFRGFILPKGTTILPLLTSALFDQKMFGNPECFDPNNFLDGNGGFKKNDAFMPFSTGKRMCLGEGLARMELFLFFTTILQTFKLKSVISPEKIDLTPKFSGNVTLPRNYQLYLLPR